MHIGTNAPFQLHYTQDNFKKLMFCFRNEKWKIKTIPPNSTTKIRDKLVGTAVVKLIHLIEIGL